MSTEESPLSEHDGGEFDFQFSEKSIRLAFIRKVYSILLIQILITCAFIAVFLYVTPVREFCHENPWTWIVALIATFVLLIALACCPDVRRTWPTNIILLGLFTLFEGYLLGAISSAYEADAVLIAAGITAVVAFGLTVFAFQTKYDFTTCTGALLVCLIVLIVFGFLCAIIRSDILNLVYASLGALLFSIYLVVDTQLMMGGKHKYSLSPEEYIFAALNLYLDIVNMFLFILSIVGRR